jgi:hypothetical protein
MASLSSFDVAQRIRIRSPGGLSESNFEQKSSFPQRLGSFDCAVRRSRIECAPLGNLGIEIV